jgi:hypothetical protein
MKYLIPKCMVGSESGAGMGSWPEPPMAEMSTHAVQYRASAARKAYHGDRGMRALAFMACNRGDLVDVAWETPPQ